MSYHPSLFFGSFRLTSKTDPTYEQIVLVRKTRRGFRVWSLKGTTYDPLITMDTFIEALQYVVKHFAVVEAPMTDDVTDFLASIPAPWVLKRIL